MEGHIHSKLKMYKPSLLQTSDILRLSRPKIRVVTGLITGYGTLCKYLTTTGISKHGHVCRGTENFL
jgi:hypothetical protein